MTAERKPIIAYTYEGAAHCPACTRARFSQSWPGKSNDELDQHWLPLDLVDEHGDPVRPVFDNNADSLLRCSDCRREFWT